MATIHQPLHSPMSEIRLITILPPQYGKTFPLTKSEHEASELDLVHCRLENVCLDDNFLLQEEHASDERGSIWPAGIWSENQMFGDSRHRRINWRYTWGDFVALSYTWGDPADTCDIIVNGRVVRVTRNLEAALRVLRGKTAIQAGCKVWIDAICIQQDNWVEKGREIGRMRSIYQKAADVVIWLGGEADDSDVGFDFVNALSGCFEVGREDVLRTTLAQELKARGPTVWKSFSALMSRNYWGRLWVVQEIAMGTHHTPVLCGSRAVSIHDLDKTLYYFNNPPKDSITATIDQVFDDLQLSYWDLESTRVYWVWDRLHSLRGFQKIRTAGSLPELISLLRYCREREATEPKDKVYGLMGLLDPSIVSRIVVDYSMTTPQLLTSFAQSCIEETNSLETFSECGGWGRPWANPAYPSWVADYTNRRFRSYLGSSEPKYNAGGSLVTRSPRFSHGGRMLTCYGVRVDVLDGFSSSYWYLGEDGNPHVADQYEDTVPADIPIEDAIIQPSRSENAYETEEGLADAIWRTLVGNRHLANVTPDPAPAHWDCVLDAFAQMPEDSSLKQNDPRGRALRFIQRNAGFIVGDQPLSSLFSRQAAARAGRRDKNVSEAVDEALTRFGRFSLTRRLVTTRDKGFVGMAPHFAIKGDVVYCFPGSSLPVLLREVPFEEGGETKKAYKIVTTIYIHGIMQGEALSHITEGNELEEVCIW